MSGLKNEKFSQKQAGSAEKTSILEDARKIVAAADEKSKSKLLYGDGFWKVRTIRRTNLRKIELHDGPLGLRIPEKGSNGKARPSVCYPSPALLACSFSTRLIGEVGTMLGREALMEGTDVVLAPGINIKRNPRCGRNFEYFSEDPFLAGKLGASFIKGIQSTGVGATLKHFFGNNQEFRRFTSSSEIDERALNEIYLRPFEIAVKEGKPWAVMCSYNLVNGVQMSSNSHYLKDVLKGEWNFEGPVMSDWGASVDPILDHASGMDLEMPGMRKKRFKEILDAQKDGKLNKSDIDESAARILTMAIKKSQRTEPRNAVNRGMARALAEKAVEESIVLAKNDRDFLPFRDYRSTCIIGAMAKEPRYQGSGSSEVNPTDLKRFYDVALLPSHENLPYARGYAYGGDFDSEKLRREAVELAKSNRKVIMFLGLPPEKESEGFDREDLRLPQEQVELVRAVSEVNRNIVVVLASGGPVEIPFLKDIRALLIAYLPGEAGADAIDSLILGKTSPSGRLAETWPLLYSDVPSSSFYPGKRDKSRYKESIYVGYRYYSTCLEPVLFPFGHGLSYGKIKYSSLLVGSKELGPGEKVSVQVDVTNQSAIKCREAVLLFVSKKTNSHGRPKRELKGFKDVILKPGETKTVAFELLYQDFSFYSDVLSKWSCEGGAFNVEICKTAERAVLSASIKVAQSDENIPPERKEAAPYLSFVKNGYLDVSDKEFDAYCGRIYEPESVPDKFDSSSTFEEISETLVGKIIKFVIKRSLLSKEERKSGKPSSFYLMAMAQPIRSARAMGFGDKLIEAIVFFANGEFSKGIKRLLASR